MKSWETVLYFKITEKITMGEFRSIFLRNLGKLRSENRNSFHTLLHRRKGITWPLMTGESGY